MMPSIVLPLPEWHRVFLPVCWALCMAALFSQWSVKMARPRLSWSLGAALGWLYAPEWALAFVMPSLVLLSWSLYQTVRVWIYPAKGHENQPTWPKLPIGLVLFWVGLGDVLVIDTFHAWPTSWTWAQQSFYAWGFETTPLLVLGLVWALSGVFPGISLGLWLSGCAILLSFVLLHEPTGNLWDALLDPVVWGFSHCLLAKAPYKCLQTYLRSRKAAADATTSTPETHGPSSTNGLPARPGL
jgi:hypothetical protein